MNTRRSTAGSSFGRPLGFAARSNWADTCAQIVFGGFLFLVFAGLKPFVAQDSANALSMSIEEGDSYRQIIFILAFVIVVGLALFRRKERVLKIVPIPFAILLLWCLISIGWAVEPGIAVRRLLFCIITIACVLCSVDMLGIKRSMQVLRFVLMVVVLVDLISVFTIPTAVHLPNEIEPELAGNWRGMHNHKNVAGAIAALAGLLFFHYGLSTRRWSDWLLFGASVIFVIGAYSKTAMGFFMLSLIISMVYRRMGRSESGRQLFRYLFGAVLAFATIGWLVDYDSFADMMADPTGFTGRVAVWQIVFNYLHDHWILGAGFSSFWMVGDETPALILDANTWVSTVPHSHNGYLEIFVTTGAVGLALAAIAFIIVPIKNLLNSNNHDIELKALLLSLFCYIVFANLLETIFLNRDRPEWVIFLIMLAVLRQIPANGAAGDGSLLMGKQPPRRAIPPAPPKTAYPRY